MSSKIANPHLYGLTDKHLIEIAHTKLTANTAKAFLAMQKAALTDGIDMAICSGYRSFAQQLNIWNAKASGNRTVLNKDNQVVEIKNLTAAALVKMILTWSALPGCSRHHWGTDLDVYDANQISTADLKLIASEYSNNGPCYKLHLWLTQYATDFGFFCPFQQDLSGVAPEPWHISHHTESNEYLRQFDSIALQQVLTKYDIKLKAEINEQVFDIVNFYVKKIAPFK